MSPPNRTSSGTAVYGRALVEKECAFSSPISNNVAPQENQTPTTDNMNFQVASADDEILAYAGTINDVIEETPKAVSSDIYTPFGHSREKACPIEAEGNAIEQERTKREAHVDKMNELSIKIGKTIADLLKNRVPL